MARRRRFFFRREYNKERRKKKRRRLAIERNMREEGWDEWEAGGIQATNRRGYRVATSFFVRFLFLLFLLQLLIQLSHIVSNEGFMYFQDLMKRDARLSPETQVEIREICAGSVDETRR
jgi:hypothetical protein